MVIITGPGPKATDCPGPWVSDPQVISSCHPGSDIGGEGHWYETFLLS